MQVRLFSIFSILCFTTLSLSFTNNRSTYTAIQCIDYTIVTVNYTVGESIPTDYDYIFRNSCRWDLNSELASYHSMSDVDSYWSLVSPYLVHPYGLKWMECAIGLWNYSQSSTWIWMDNTPYDFGQPDTNTSQWADDVDNQKDINCVKIWNNQAKKYWDTYQCESDYNVNCGVCNTARFRSYKVGLTGNILNTTDVINSIDSSMAVYLLGSDLFGTGIESVGFENVLLNVNVSGASYKMEKMFVNQSNVGPIAEMIVVNNSTMNLSIGMLFLIIIIITCCMMLNIDTCTYTLHKTVFQLSQHNYGITTVHF